ncbi:hypothetical protein PCANC_24649 [Puccinia coronata f. sp. avenae]|uniref:Uncharacterized protein n=1 Tax=Puccinia coronata f. sp. avenae TaxID=200324 RepID=A0A2N5S5T1_9BASI|nr:hypothetical protein PCANC_24649 [Puccinia coronata f. sp. avenae]
MTPTSHTGNGKDTHPILQHRINLSTTHNNHNTTTAPSSSTLLKWRKPRLTRLVALRYLILTGSALFLYLRYLHRLIFIDYSAFPPAPAASSSTPATTPGSQRLSITSPMISFAVPPPPPAAAAVHTTL